MKTAFLRVKKFVKKYKKSSVAAGALAFVLILWAIFSGGGAVFNYAFIKGADAAPPEGGVTAVAALNPTTPGGSDVPSAYTAHLGEYGDFLARNGAYGLSSDDLTDSVRLASPAVGAASDGQMPSPGAGALSYSLQITASGTYNLVIDYYIEHNGMRDTEIEIWSVGSDGPVLSEERAPLKGKWVNRMADGEFARDSRGNEIPPMQDLSRGWQRAHIYNYRFDTPMPAEFILDADITGLTIKIINGGDVLIGCVAAVPASLPRPYADYIKDYADAGAGSGALVIEAERPAYKNDTMGLPDNARDMNVTPYKTHEQLLNIISDMDDPATEVFYEFEVKADGLYSLSFVYNAPEANRTAYLRVAVDGAAPFRELLHYPLSPKSGFSLHTVSADGKAAPLFLTAGAHTLSFRSDISLFGDIMAELREAANDVNDIYLDLKKIAGAANDPNREWTPDTDFPGVVDKLKKIRTRLSVMKTDLRKLNGGDVNWQASIFADIAEKSLNGLLDNPAKIANKYAALAEGSGSTAQSLSNALLYLQEAPIEVDRMVFTPSAEKPSFKKRGVFASFWEGVKRFFRSFAGGSSVKSGGKTLDVWVYKARRYVDVIKLFYEQSGFSEKTGYDVKISMLTEEGKLILSNAGGVRPDVVLGAGTFMPYEMGMRNLTYDLSKFSDYPDVIDRFSPGAMIPLIADGNGLGLPETQDFYVMFYRNDIIGPSGRYGIPVPQTWEDVVRILPELQRLGMNFYSPLSNKVANKPFQATAPFIQQFGGNLYRADASGAAINGEREVEAIKFMTDLYTLYGLPQQVADFYEAFRNGSIPIGISTFQTYVMLTFAAPEIAGRWSIAPAPGKIARDADGGVVYETDESGASAPRNERWQSGAASTILMLDNGDEGKAGAAWEFLKWWTDYETQMDYSQTLRMRYGKNWLLNTANLRAFEDGAVFPEEHKRVIMEQWKWLSEVPKVPGWYILERELSNIWNKVVMQGQNPRGAINSALTSIDMEIDRKLIEFGYKDGRGNFVKPYKITTLEEVERIKRRVA